MIHLTLITFLIKKQKLHMLLYSDHQSSEMIILVYNQKLTKMMMFLLEFSRNKE